jgi:hypothetical protein
MVDVEQHKFLWIEDIAERKKCRVIVKLQRLLDEPGDK